MDHYITRFANPCLKRIMHRLLVEGLISIITEPKGSTPQIQMIAIVMWTILSQFHPSHNIQIFPNFPHNVILSAPSRSSKRTISSRLPIRNSLCILHFPNPATHFDGIRHPDFTIITFTCNQCYSLYLFLSFCSFRYGALCFPTCVIYMGQHK